MAVQWEQADRYVTEIGFRLQRLVIRKSEIKAVMVWLIFVIASFIHDFYPMPASYLSSKKNILNVYFVKKGWGWTFALLALYVLSILIYYKEKDAKVIMKTTLRLVYGSFGWFLSTSAFQYVEDLTGSCEGDVYSKSKQSCIAAKSRWIGFDISGHCFLSTYCILILNEELSKLTHYKEQISLENNPCNDQGTMIVYQHFRKAKNSTFLLLIDKISIFMTFMVILWEFMLMLTCIYYHTIYQKLLGTVFGILVWYLLYHVACDKNHPLAPMAPITPKT